LVHIRRKFFESLKNDAHRAETAIAFIKALGSTEEKARLLTLDRAQRLELRRKEARLIVDLMGKWLRDEYQKVPRKQGAKALFQDKDPLPENDPFRPRGPIDPF